MLRTLEGIQAGVQRAGGKQVSLADLIVLGGCRGGRAGRRRTPATTSRCRSRPGRTDASQEQTDVESFAALEPTADGFRNYLGKGHRLPAEYLLVDRANLLTLSAPEMTVLVGGLRVLGANYRRVAARRPHRRRPGTLTNDFFVNLLDLGTTWKPTVGRRGARSRAATPPARSKWTGSRVDLVFGSNSELRALAEVYASDDAQEKFVRDFVAAWVKVMNLDRLRHLIPARREARSRSRPGLCVRRAVARGVGQGSG